jgi:site-specific recombinase XerC
VLQDISSSDVSSTRGCAKKEGASRRTINLEVGTLRAILRKHKLWQNLAGDVKPMKVRADIGRALSDDEIKGLLAAAQKSRSRSLYLLGW